MIAELSHFALFLALMASGCQSILPLYGSLADRPTRTPWLMASADMFTLIASSAVLFAFVGLVLSFVSSDFSVALVANHSHSAKPLI